LCNITGYTIKRRAGNNRPELIGEKAAVSIVTSLEIKKGEPHIKLHIGHHEIFASSDS